MIGGRTATACALTALLASACGDDPPAGPGDSTGASTGALTSTSAPVPTTSSAATDDATGTATATGGAATTGTTTTGAVDPTTGAPATSSTTLTTADTTTSSETGSTTTTSETTADTGTTADTTTSDDTTTLGPGSSSTGGCVTPLDCPPPPPVECVEATCEAGICGAGPVAPGTPCSLGVCDAQGGCVECLQQSDCMALEMCTANACVPVPPTCSDGLKNGGETDTDCGGPTCPPCPDGDACLVDADCVSASCDNNVCGQPVPLCAQQPPDAQTGQRCPLFMPCAQSSECGIFVGCQQWFCNNAKTCELNALVNCWTDVGGACNAEVVFSQQTLPPVAKRFVPPDGVDFRELASLVFTVKNNTASDLYLDKLPLVLDVMGNGSKFDVSSVKIFDNSGGSEHGGGDLLVCLTANPFSFPANGVMGPCAGSAFSRVPKGQSNQFLVNVAFAADKTFINGRSYRLRLASTAGVEFKVGFNGPKFAGTTCGVPNEGYTGAWVTAQTP